ncbi:MAG: dUTP diphosphatase [Patescibacteria group bacterium]
MKVKVRRIDKSLPLPSYGTGGSAGLDCFVREATIIPPGELAYIPLNICVQPPKNHFVLIAARSSLPKRGLFLANGIGIGDEDYSGDEDEYKAQVYNYTDKPVTIEKGERIIQLIFLPYDKVEWNEVESLGNNNRGGFGTTGR